MIKIKIITRGKKGKKEYAVKFDDKKKRFVSSPELEMLGADITNTVRSYAWNYVRRCNISHAVDEIISDMIEYAFYCVVKYDCKRASLDTFLRSCCRNRAGRYFATKKHNEILGIGTYFDNFENENRKKCLKCEK